MNGALYLTPRLTLAIVETTLTGLIACLAPGPTLGPEPALGPSKNPLKTAPRQIDVRLNQNNAH